MIGSSPVAPNGDLFIICSTPDLGNDAPGAASPPRVPSNPPGASSQFAVAAKTRPARSTPAALGRKGSRLRLGPVETILRRCAAGETLLPYREKQRRHRRPYEPPSEEDLLRSIAFAIASGKQLAQATGLSCTPWRPPPVDVPRAAGVSTPAAAENQWWPVVWTEDSAFLYVPTPPKKGRKETLWISLCGQPHVTPRSVAIAALSGRWETFLHLGIVPQRPEREGCTVQGGHEAVRLLSAVLDPKAEAPFAEPCLVARDRGSPRSPVESWCF